MLHICFIEFLTACIMNVYDNPLYYDDDDDDSNVNDSYDNNPADN